MARSIDYDDKNLQQLFAELEPKRRLQAVKGGFRKEANQVRKTVINNLRSSIQSNNDLEKGVRAIVFKRKAGFRVTVGTKQAGKSGKGEAGFHTNRKGLKKPVLIWAEAGTEERKTKSSGGKRAARLRSSHRTGRMKRYGFMEQTLNGVRDTVTANIRNMVMENVEQIAKKYGCK
ncbi:hypothetical protein [uncultured Bacteroides sp.]|uniref:hypothetical protein n=1 Tax=uncultured Bacteroides sp. TaxID=162156 RepID=UPI0025E09AA6|nr:hypothetical protein [uncultured Bacteroides sp.]